MAVTDAPLSNCKLSLKRKPARKALIVGIAYKGTRTDGLGELRTPHKDAREWKAFLIGTFIPLAIHPTIAYTSRARVMVEKYQFCEEEITLMLDDEGCPLIPTRENIVRVANLSCHSWMASH